MHSLGFFAPPNIGRTGQKITVSTKAVFVSLKCKVQTLALNLIKANHETKMRHVALMMIFLWLQVILTAMATVAIHGTNNQEATPPPVLLRRLVGEQELERQGQDPVTYCTELPDKSQDCDEIKAKGDCESYRFCLVLAGVGDGNSDGDANAEADADTAITKWNCVANSRFCLDLTNEVDCLYYEGCLWNGHGADGGDAYNSTKLLPTLLGIVFAIVVVGAFCCYKGGRSTSEQHQLKRAKQVALAVRERKRGEIELGPTTNNISSDNEQHGKFEFQDEQGNGQHP